MENKHGGKREGAGRPEGSKNARTQAVIEYLDPDDHNPIITLVNIMNKAFEARDLRLSAYCAKALLPYYAPPPKLEDETEDDTTGDQRTPIQVNVNFPIPGSGWRDKLEAHSEDDRDDYIEGDLI